MLPALLLALSLLASGVDTRVGTAASSSPTASVFGTQGEVFGNTLPAVTEPHGQTFWTPQTRESVRKGVAPYYYDDPQCLGLRASHWLSGGATQDYGAFAILPADAPVPLDHGAETATPAYYALGGWEMTGRSHSAIFRFADCEYLRVSLLSEFADGTLELDTLAREIRGANPVHRIYQGKGQPAGYDGCLVLRYDTPAECVEYEPGRSVLLRFRERGTHLVKAATSFTGVAAAARNLEAEIPHWDFDRTRAELEAVWEQRLGQIRVESRDSAAVRELYGSLWRASLLPRMVSDCGERSEYDDFSLWDTFRALHPLLTVLEPSRVSDMITSLLDRYDRGGWLPTFPCWGSYTSAMIGDHAISVIADAYLKGIRGFDVQKAYEAMRRNAFESPGGEAYLTDSLYQDGRGRRALQSYLRYGYIPLEDEVPFAYHSREQVSRTLEYAYDDWCLAQVALRLGRREDARQLLERAGWWRNVFDPRTRRVQGRHADGRFLDDDNYLEKTSFITEGTPAHYSWFVPHDVPGLMQVTGGEAAFVARLDSLFAERRYWHGNEPCHQIAYLYDYTAQPWKAQRAVREILRTEYRDAPDGLSGNDDAGQMSAWYIFSALGFYPVCPGSGEYALGSPLFDRAQIRLENGKTFTVTAKNAAPGNVYVQRARLNGRRLRRPFLRHRDIVRGGRLVLVMGPVPPYRVKARGGQIQAAIDDCARHGGGRVVVPRGRWTVAGLELCSDMELYLRRGAVLLGSRNEADYRSRDVIGAGDMGAVPVMIGAHGARNILLSGRGIIDGQAVREPYQRSEVTAVTDSVTGREVYNAMRYGADYRSKWRKVAPWTTCINFTGCSGVVLKGITVKESNGWSVHLEDCTDVLVDGVGILSSRINGVNADGLDIDGCTRVRVRGCIIDTGDDALCFKTTGQTPCTDVLVEGCTLSSSSAAVKIGTESHADFRGITVRGCRIVGANRGLNIILRDGGNVRDILFEDLEISCRRHAPFWWGNGDPLWFTIQKRGAIPSAGTVKGVIVRNVQARGQSGVRLEGFSEPLRDITLEHFHLTVEPERDAVDKRARDGYLFDGVDGLVLDDVTLAWDGWQEEWQEDFVFRNCKNIVRK